MKRMKRMKRMNSNLSKHLHLPAHILLGIEFGVRDSVGMMKHNIKEAFLLSKILTPQDLERGTLLSPNKRSEEYILVADSKLRNALCNKGVASVIISFQRRTEGNFAVARLWESSRILKKPISSKERKDIIS